MHPTSAPVPECVHPKARNRKRVQNRSEPFLYDLVLTVGIVPAIHLFPPNVSMPLARRHGVLPGKRIYLFSVSHAPRGKKHPISNRLTVSNGFDRQLPQAES